MSEPTEPGTASPEGDAPDAPRVGHVLIVDADYDVLGALSTALRRRGHQVVLAADGRTGLARAVEVGAEVVLVDRDVPVLDVRTFLEVLRDNPRTSGTATFIMGTGEPSRLAAIDGRSQPIIKPFNAEEVAARVDDVYRARFGPKREQELRGEFAQVGLFDLLQVFGANRRTGRLEIDTVGAAGRVWVEEGRIVDATYGGVVGEKAIFRILGSRDGSFVFHPAARASARRIDMSTDQLLMEGARRADEMARLREFLPALGASVGISFLPDDISAGARAVVAQLAEPRPMTELLDRLDAPDLDILRALSELGERDALLVFDPEEERIHLAKRGEGIALGAAAHRLRRRGLDGPIRLPILFATRHDVSRFSRALGRIAEFVAAPRPPTAAGPSAFGPLGVLRLDGAEVELLALPLDTAFRPLYGPTFEAVTTALILDEPDDGARGAGVERLLEFHEVRVVRAPTGWERHTGAREALRLALGTDQVARR